MTSERNDPCPCGSGKKFKRCCGGPRRDLLAEAAARIRSIQETLEPRILRHGRETIGEDLLDRAWRDFALDAEGLEPDGSEEQLFHPWMLYRWTPSEESPKKRRRRAGLPLALSFLDAHGRDLVPAESDFLLTTTVSPFSFHEVVDVEPSRTLRLRDVFLEQEALVYERSGSETLQTGDLVFARVVALGDLALLIGSGSLVIPPDQKIPLIRFRKKFRKDLRREGDAGLLAADDTLRTAYFDLRDSIVNAPPPVLQNTDGDPFEMQKLAWKTPGAEETFRALASLSVTSTEDEIREDADLDPNGEIHRVEFAWEKAGNKLHKDWSNTILGRIVIDGRRLTVEVNSSRRADRIRAEVVKRLGKRAFGPSVERIETDEPDVGPATAPFGSEDGALSEEALRSHPEVVEAMRRMNEAHWDSWISERIPALANKKPIDLVKTQDGREMVEALLLSFERGPTIPGLRESNDMNFVRRRLDLPLRTRFSDAEGS